MSSGAAGASSGGGAPGRERTFVRVVDPAEPEVLAMVERMLDHLAALYERFDRPVPVVDPSEFRAPRGAWVLVELDGRAVASGGVRACEVGGPVAELKRIWVEPDARGAGLSRVLLAALEERASELGYESVNLVTGGRQPEAMRLYETSGYERIPNYGRNAGNGHLTSYAKSLVPATPDRIASRSAR